MKKTYNALAYTTSREEEREELMKLDKTFLVSRLIVKEELHKIEKKWRRQNIIVFIAILTSAIIGWLLAKLYIAFL